MATQKEMEALTQVVNAAVKVNASSERVNVEVTISNMSVGVNISDPVEVLANCDAPDKWDWLFYGVDRAYFSNDVFTEERFLERCQEFIDVINGFEGYVAAEVSA